ncbi:helix-turn-helix domain-containing protein [Profundibacter sp.]
MKVPGHRAKIRTLLAQGVPAAKIAADLGVAPSTVYRARSTNLARKADRAAYLVVSARLTEGERAGLDRQIKAGSASSRGAVLRRLARMASDYYAVSPEEEVFLTAADKHLSRLGGNFNQIAAALSASMKKVGRTDATVAQIKMMHGAADDVAEIRVALRTMLENAQIKTGTIKARLAQRELLEDGGDE